MCEVFSANDDTKKEFIEEDRKLDACTNGSIQVLNMFSEIHAGWKYSYNAGYQEWPYGVRTTTAPTFGQYQRAGPCTSALLASPPGRYFSVRAIS